MALLLLLLPVAWVIGGLFDFDPFLPALAKQTAMVAAPAVFTAFVIWRPTAPPALVYLGAISYGIYLFQDPAIRLFGPILAGPVTLGFAVLVWVFIERPSIAFGKRLRTAETILART